MAQDWKATEQTKARASSCQCCKVAHNSFKEPHQFQLQYLSSAWHPHSAACTDDGRCSSLSSIATRPHHSSASSLGLTSDVASCHLGNPVVNFVCTTKDLLLSTPSDSMVQPPSTPACSIYFMSSAGNIRADQSSLMQRRALLMYKLLRISV
jgi:hypothetical protein